MDSENSPGIASGQSLAGTPEPQQTTMTLLPEPAVPTAAMRGLELRHAALARILQEHNDQIVTFIERVCAAESRGDDLAQRLRTFEREVAALRARVAEQESENAALMRHEQDAARERVELRGQLAALKQSGERYRTETQTLSEGYRARVETLEHERDELRAQLVVLTRRKAELEREVATSRDQRDAATREREFYRTYMEEFKAIAEACLEKMRAMRDYCQQHGLAPPGDPASPPSVFTLDDIALPAIRDMSPPAPDERPLGGEPPRRS